jgi:hypothetical protein
MTVSVNILKTSTVYTRPHSVTQVHSWRPQRTSSKWKHRYHGFNNTFKSMSCRCIIKSFHLVFAIAVDYSKSTSLQTYST